MRGAGTGATVAAAARATAGAEQWREVESRAELLGRIVARATHFNLQQLREAHSVLCGIATVRPAGRRRGRRGGGRQRRRRVEVAAELSAGD
eukprot:gene20046-biopygen14605